MNASMDISLERLHKYHSLQKSRNSAKKVRKMLMSAPDEQVLLMNEDSNFATSLLQIFGNDPTVIRMLAREFGIPFNVLQNNVSISRYPDLLKMYIENGEISDVDDFQYIMEGLCEFSWGCDSPSIENDSQTFSLCLEYGAVINKYMIRGFCVLKSHNKNYIDLVCSLTTDYACINYGLWFACRYACDSYIDVFLKYGADITIFASVARHKSFRDLYSLLKQMLEQCDPVYVFDFGMMLNRRIMDDDVQGPRDLERGTFDKMIELGADPVGLMVAIFSCEIPEKIEDLFD